MLAFQQCLFAVLPGFQSTLHCSLCAARDLGSGFNKKPHRLPFIIDGFGFIGFMINGNGFWVIGFIRVSGCRVHVGGYDDPFLGPVQGTDLDRHGAKEGP